MISTVSDKAKEHATPDSSKSTTDKLKETVTDTTDKVARGAQSDHDKSTAQSLADKSGREKDDKVHGGPYSSSYSRVLITDLCPRRWRVCHGQGQECCRHGRQLLDGHTPSTPTHLSPRCKSTFYTCDVEA